MSTNSNNQFGSKIGLIAATVGSAVGLGNIWRFPAEAQANGGAAFLLLYIICLLVMGIPVMLAEFSLGRAGRGDAISVFRKLAPGRAWWLIGLMGVIGSYLIACFYMVVEGWTLEYLWQSVNGNLFEGVGHLSESEGFAASDAKFSAKMAEYINTPLAPMAFTWGVILINLGVLVCGVQKGIERLSNIMMPLLFVLLLTLCCITLSLPGAGEGVRWFLAPDFSKITVDTIINALGQTFFSLSLGMGILITYAAYYPDNTKLVPTSGIVVLMSLLVALLTGFVIFPSVSSFGLQDHSLVGTTLVFQTLPEVFACLPAPQIWAVAFFLLLFVAALTSTVSILEVSIAFFNQRVGLSRLKSCLIVLVPMLAFSGVCSLSFSSLADFKIFGYTIFDFLDTFTTNLLLPIGSIAICLFVGWFAPKHLLADQLSNHGSLRSPLTGIVLFIIRYVAPVLIAAILISSLL